MKAKPEYRDRPDIEVAVLDALVDRAEEGMTVLSLRARVDEGIDDIERALSTLKEEGLITVEESGEDLVIKPADAVVPDPEDFEDDPSFFDELRRRLPF